MKNHYIWVGSFLIMLLFSACVMLPKGAEPVTDFDANRYLGKWYEIARMDNRFEKNLQQVTAQYSLNEDGNITVWNRGYDTLKKEWKSVKGKAKFRAQKTTAALKVSFFGPFYAGYNVIALDPAYRYALVAGQNLDYLWILSRDITIPDAIKASFIKTAQAIGYDTDQFVWVIHEKEIGVDHE
ncbi:Outer membrane lipoprotein Blc precursor [compost metagenome]